MAFDDLLPTIGEFGTFQKIICALVFTFKFPAAANVLSIVFLATSTDHWCSVSSWDIANCTGLGLNDSECAFYKKHLSIPYTVVEDDIVYDQCHKYDVSRISFADALALFDENTNQSGYRHDVISCDQGWEHGNSHTLTQSFDLVCDRKYLINLSQCIFFIGVLIGSVSCGAIADRFGRKPALILCNVVIIVFGVGAAFSPNYITFVVLRTIQGGGCFGLATVSHVIGTEFVGPSRRAFVSIFMTISFTCGYLLLTLYAYFIRNWRYLLLGLNLTFAIPFLFYPFIPESVRWQMSKGRYKEAEKTVRRVAKINKIKLTEDFFYQHNFYKKKETTELCDKRDPNLSDLFRTPILRQRTLILICVWMTNNLVFYGLHLSTGNFGVNVYLTFLISGVVEMIAIVMSTPAIEWFGRRPSLIVCLAISGIASLIIIFLPLGAAKTGIAMAGKFGIAGSWVVGLIYPVEVLPTPIRSVGVGICSSTSRIVAVATPLLLLLYDVWAPGPLVLQTIAALATAALSLILPETKGKKLPETLKDGENFGKKTKTQTSEMKQLPAQV